MSGTAHTFASASETIFVVEDEMMVALLLESMLEELGFRVLGPVGTLEEALEVSKYGNFDAAILDVNINGARIYPVAEALSRRGKPFLFATGYGHSGLPPSYGKCPVLQKPYPIENLQNALRRVLEK